MRSTSDIEIVRPNRRELIYSVLLVVAFLLEDNQVPMGWIDYLLHPLLLLVSTFCALNAVLDWRRMRRFERVFAWFWFVLVLIATVLMVVSIANVKYFADA